LRQLDHEDQKEQGWSNQKKEVDNKTKRIRPFERRNNVFQTKMARNAKTFGCSTEKVAAGN
jgi:hypothetical protein